MKIETITKDYRLTEEAIDSIAEETESFLYSVGIERANVFRIHLSLEEALLRWMDHFGTGGPLFHRDKVAQTGDYPGGAGTEL